MRARRGSQPDAVRRATDWISKGRSTISGIGRQRLGAAEPAPTRRGIQHGEERVLRRRQYEAHTIETFDPLGEWTEPVLVDLRGVAREDHERRFRFALEVQCF